VRAARWAGQPYHLPYHASQLLHSLPITVSGCRISTPPSQLSVPSQQPARPCLAAPLVLMLWALSVIILLCCGHCDHPAMLWAL
jgi:hypothetical protein